MARVTALAFVALAFAVGCASSTPDDASTSTGEVTTGDAGADAAAQGACVPCAERFAAGLRAYESARRSCFCTEEVCRDACGSTLCPFVPKPTDAACNACMGDNTKCVLTVTAACNADAECTKYVLCKVDTPCDPDK